MTLQAPMRCSELAEELEEPMAGTVDQRVRWLLIEDRSAWGSEAVTDVIGNEAAATAKRLGVRVQLIRRSEGPPQADLPRRATLVDTEAGVMASREVRSPRDLDVPAVATMAIADFGEPTDGPIFLVCTNGKRDACCALRGRALLAAIGGQMPDATWETTHLGGHRFAANLVCLPDGIVYGRVRPLDGLVLAVDYRDGRLDPEKLRGRSAWPPPAQVAEIEVRRTHGLLGVADLRLVAVEGDESSTTVTLAVGDATHRVQLRADRSQPPRPTSCRADALEAPVHWRLA